MSRTCPAIEQPDQHQLRLTGVWASTSLDLGDESIRSVDTSAVEVTTWPWALVSEPKIAVDAPGVDAARSCL